MICYLLSLQIQDIVSKTKSDYEKYMDIYKVSKAKYEEQYLRAEVMRLKSANTDKDARLDIKAKGFWRRGQTAFFDVRVTHVNSQTNANKDTKVVFKEHEQSKKRGYLERVLEIEHASFTPLVLGTNGGKPGKKLEEFKDKYQRSCRKLHATHNEYIILLCEANEYERHFRKFLLPGLLQYQETVLEDTVNNWKIILGEYMKHTDMTGDTFTQVQRRIYSTVEDINGNDEYTGFIKRHKTDPVDQINFNYDFSLLVDFPGNLKPNEITVDDSTLKAIRLKLQGYESRLSECQFQLKEKESQLIQCENEMAAIRKSSDTTGTLAVKKRAIDILKRSIMELRCQEERLITLKNLVEKSILTLGTEPPPPALQLDETLTNGDQANNNFQESLGRSKSKLLKEKLLNSFHKKQNNLSVSPPTPPAKDFIKITAKSQNNSESKIASNVTTECYSIVSYRLPAPENTPESVYNVMLQCWEYDPEKRSHFAEICKILDNINVFASN
ncbi:Tyrosine-protein kinase Fer [Nymphon striatum]|nr:Tyrosine-protein kinase Fer [Nymphon striatum]